MSKPQCPCGSSSIHSYCNERSISGFHRTFSHISSSTGRSCPSSQLIVVSFFSCTFLHLLMLSQRGTCRDSRSWDAGLCYTIYPTRGGRRCLCPMLTCGSLQNEYEHLFHIQICLSKQTFLNLASQL